MLRDRLTVGIRDLSLSETLQTDPMLNLEKETILIMQKAAVKDHCHELNYARWAMKLLLVDLEATNLFKTERIINLNKGTMVYKMWS